MYKSLLLALAMLAALLAGVAVAPDAQARNMRCAQCGTVERVDRIWYEGRRDSGREGAVIGAIIGGAIGNQAGRGDGRTAATIAGAVVGGLIGRDVDRRNDRDRGERGLRLEVRMDRGFYQTVEIHGDQRIYRGDRVRLRNGRVDLIR